MPVHFVKDTANFQNEQHASSFYGNPNEFSKRAACREEEKYKVQTSFQNGQHAGTYYKRRNDLS